MTRIHCDRCNAVIPITLDANHVSIDLIPSPFFLDSSPTSYALVRFTSRVEQFNGVDWSPVDLCDECRNIIEDLAYVEIDRQREDRRALAKQAEYDAAQQPYVSPADVPYRSYSADAERAFDTKAERRAENEAREFAKDEREGRTSPITEAIAEELEYD